MSVLWSIAELLEAMQAEARGALPESVSGISIDSRTVAAGEAYFAIRGDRHDGHDFTRAALESGAGAAVLARERLAALDLPADAPVLIVDDVLDALVALGRAARARSQARIVAVTGSVGKTTTKEMLRTALAPSGAVHASAASFNNHWGVPLTLARLPREARFGVFEIGMNHAGEITPLVAMVRPHVAMVTNVGPVHLEAFESVEGIARAKGEIFGGIVADGDAIVPADSEWALLLTDLAGAAGVARVHGFGRGEGAEFRLVTETIGRGASELVLEIAGRPVSMTLGLAGSHMALNAACVLGTLHLVGADVEAGARALEAMAPVKGRGARHTVPWAGGSLTVIDESYNANPSSMAAALSVLEQVRPGPGGRRIAVLGDMLELGSRSSELHAALAGPIARSGADLVLLAGPQMTALLEELMPAMRMGHAASASGLEPLLATGLRAGDVVMLKASNGLGFARLVEALVSGRLGRGSADEAAGAGR